MQLFKAKDLGGDVIEVIAANNWIAGTGSFVVASYKIDGGENYEYIGLNKYQVTIKTAGGKLQMVCTETDELTQGTVLFLRRIMA